MSGRMRWERLRHRGKPTLDIRTEAEMLARADRWRRARRRNATQGQTSMSLIKPAPVPIPPLVSRGPLCRIRIIELSQAARYRKVFAVLQTKCPEQVPTLRWELATADASRFLGKFGLEAERLGWSSADIFGLPPIPAKPAAWFNRMARLDHQGLVWCLLGRRVVSLNETEAVIENKATGSTTRYRRKNKSALGACSIA